MDLMASIGFLLVVLAGSVLAVRDWHTWRHSFCLLTSAAFVLLIPVGFWDIYSSINRVDFGDRLGIQIVILAFCYFVYLRQHFGLSSKTPEEEFRD
jgi:hypothetical protein